MNIHHEHDTHGGVFRALNEQQQELGFLSYCRIAPELIAAEHTVVNPAFQGQGIAGLLLQEAVAYSRENHLKIKPVCSYVHKALLKDPTLGDVIIAD